MNEHDLLRLVFRDALVRVGCIADAIADEEAWPALVLAEQLEHELRQRLRRLGAKEPQQRRSA